MTVTEPARSPLPWVVGAFAGRGALWGTGLAIAIALALNVSIGVLFIPIGTIAGALAGTAAGIGAGLSAARLDRERPRRLARIGGIAALASLVVLVPLAFLNPLFFVIGGIGVVLLAPLTMHTLEVPPQPAERLGIVGILLVVLAAVVSVAFLLLELESLWVPLLGAALAFAATITLALVLVRRIRDRNEGIERTVILGVLAVSALALGAGMASTALALGS